MYKVRDNVYWETESCIQRRNAPPLSKDTSSNVSSLPSTRPGSFRSAQVECTIIL